MDIKELDVVRLKDGRYGTVVGFYESESILLLEVCANNGKTVEMPFVPTSEVTAVEYKYISKTALT